MVITMSVIGKETEARGRTTFGWTKEGKEADQL